MAEPARTRPPPTGVADREVLATVKSHVTHILGKLSAANRTQAVTRAPRAGPADLMAAVRLIAKVAS